MGMFGLVRSAALWFLDLLKQKQPPGIFISVAVWGKSQPWLWTKVIAVNFQNKGNSRVLDHYDLPQCALAWCVACLCGTYYFHRHCFHFHPYQWPLIACRDNIILRKFRLHQDRNASGDEGNHSELLCIFLHLHCPLRLSVYIKYASCCNITEQPVFFLHSFHLSPYTKCVTIRTGSFMRLRKIFSAFIFMCCMSIQYAHASA